MLLLLALCSQDPFLAFLVRKSLPHLGDDLGMLVRLILEREIQLLLPGALLVICAEEQHPRIALHVI